MGIFKNLLNEMGDNLKEFTDEISGNFNGAIPISGKAGKPEDFMYDLNSAGDGAVIKGVKRKAKTIIIPEILEGYPVKEIASLKLVNDTWWGNETLSGPIMGRYVDPVSNIIFPKTVVWFEEGALVDNAITEITLPEGIDFISPRLFENCIFLRSIRIPPRVTSICESAFSYCSKLKEVYLPEGLTTIGRSAFFQCIGLEKITLPKSLEIISDSAFSNCENLQEITLPESLESIGYYAFSYCKNLVSVKPPSHPVQYIATNNGSSTFYGCSKLSLASKKLLRDSGYDGDF